MTAQQRRLIPVAALALGALALTTGCATNPATGRNQLSLYSEAQEVELGRNADRDLVAEYGLYDDPELASYVDALGQELAATSERPGLPWTFRVLDDPAVNAYALPGGYIYMTRGILSHMGSESELAAVLGHEIGHVTARHGVNRMSKAQIANIGLGVGAVLAPELARGLGGEAQSGLQLLFLKYSRDDERQADRLGHRYADRIGQNPEGMVNMFTMLSAQSRLAGVGRLPGYLLTHPHPEERLMTAS
ncbi:MAG: M48 family metallopeptidase [Acidobacteriota bacterium]